MNENKDFLLLTSTNTLSKIDIDPRLEESYKRVLN